jgi:small ubiquitin-related modifier
MKKRLAQSSAQTSAAQKCLDILDLMNFDSVRSSVNVPASLLGEYKRFLALKVAARDFDASVLSPPQDLDTIWHAHILDTNHYRIVCDALGGFFIHHNPNGGADAVARDSRRQTALTHYEQSFGTAPECWKRGVRPVLGAQQVPQAVQHTNEAKRARNSPAAEAGPPATPPPERPRLGDALEQRQVEMAIMVTAPTAPAVHGSQLFVGAFVMARYQASTHGPAVTKWFPGWIMAATNDSFCICYEDKDYEVGVVSKYIKLAPHQKVVPAWATEQHEKKRRKAEAAGQAALQRSQAEAARRLQQRATGDETIQIKMVSQDGTELYFKLKGRTPLSQAFDVACQRFGISREKLRFLFDGNVIYDGNTTPQDLEMEDGDTLDVVVAQAGC